MKKGKGSDICVCGHRRGLHIANKGGCLHHWWKGPESPPWGYVYCPCDCFKKRPTPKKEKAR